MEFSKLLHRGTRISLTNGVSLFRANDESFFLKYNNKLFSISSRSELGQQSRIFHILKRPRKLEEILNLMSGFKRGEVIAVLHTLYQLSLITVRSGMNKNTSKRFGLDSSYFLMDQIGERKPSLADSQITLIGNGFLADRITAILKKLDMKINRIKTFGNEFKPTKKMSSKNFVPKNKGPLEIASFSPSSSFMSHFNESDLIIVAEDYQNIALFESVNKISFKTKKAWLRVSFDDNIGYLGPLVVPRRTSCFNCCELRLVTNSRNYEYELWRNKEHIPKTKLEVPEIFADMLSTVSVKEAFRYLTHREEPETIDNLIVFDTRQLNLTKHRLFRHPNCIYCNSIRTIKKIHSESLRSSFNTARQIVTTTNNFGDSNPLSENELLERLRKLIDIRTGIILESEKLFVNNRLDINSHYFFTATCSKPLRIGLAGELTKLVQLDNSLISPSPSGSGLSPDEAEMHTLMEAVERYSNMVVDESRFIWSAYQDIEKMAVNPLDLGLYLDKHYDETKAISRFSVDLEIPWIDGKDLFSGKPVFIAADFVHYPSIREKPLVFETSNGASAHTDLVQSIINGLYEVIERDSFLTMWLNRISMPILDIKRLPCEFNEPMKLISEYGMSVKLVDLTNDSRIPTVMAVCCNDDPDKYPALAVGTGTHVEPERAIRKALLEMEFGLISTLEDPEERNILDPNKISSPFENAIYYLNPKMRKHWEFMISSKHTSKPPRLAGRFSKDNHVLLMRMVTHLQTMGHRVVWVDITPTDIRKIGLSAVKVFVTGFQPMYVGNKLRLNLGRLHESAEYVCNNNMATRDSTELNYAPHPLA
jgi:ribosomal protein S12 methylthiotransferase accessory factor